MCAESRACGVGFELVNVTRRGEKNMLSRAYDMVVLQSSIEALKS